MNTDDVAERIEAIHAIRRLGAPRPVQDALTRKPARTGVPHDSGACTKHAIPDRLGSRYRLRLQPDDHSTRGTPYRQAHPMMAHPVRLEPVPAKRRRVAPDLLVIAVILAVVLAASLVGVKL